MTPVSEGERKVIPRKSGRRPGNGYGASRPRPVPDRVDRTVKVGLPPSCPHCGRGDVSFLKMVA